MEINIKIIMFKTKNQIKDKYKRKNLVSSNICNLGTMNVQFLMKSEFLELYIPTYIVMCSIREFYFHRIIITA